MRVRSRSLLASGAVVALAAGGVLVQGGAAYAGAPSVTVTTWADLVDAFADGDTITLGADLTQPTGQQLAVGGSLSVTLDLNGHSLTATTAPEDEAGVGVPSGASLTIEDTAGGGSLTATGDYGSAGIGGDYEGSSGAVIIESGTVTATGGYYAPGIGGGENGVNGSVTINGGTVNATGASTGGAGIGGGAGGAGGTVTIAGGTVTAQGGGPAAGIGGGVGGAGGTVTIDGGTVTATGGSNAAGVGGGYNGAGADVTIDGGDLTASSPTAGMALGAGKNGSSFGSVDIESGSLTIPAGASWTVPATATVTNKGTIGGTGTVSNLGTIVNTGTVDVAAVTGHNYLLSFDLAGGALTDTGSLDEDGTLAVYAGSVSAAQESLPTPTRAGYSFAAWRTSAGARVGSATGLEILFGTGTDGAPVAAGLTADWTLDATVPDTPGVVSAVAGDGSAVVSWVAPVSDGGSPITSYTVQWFGTPSGVGSQVCASSPCTITGLTNGHSYAFQVFATNAAGDSGTTAMSNPVTPTASTGTGTGPGPGTSVGPGPSTGSGWYADPLSKAKRHHLVAAHPGREGGKVKQTKASFRSHNGSLLVSAGKARGHQLGKGQGVQLTGLFRFDSATLTKAGRHKLARLAKSMKDVKAFTCEGYADYGGAAGHEQTLSQGRAQAVCVVLTRKLDRPLHAKAAGYGSTRPVAVGGSAQSRTDNRRVDLLVRR